jgi:tetratricopeptide (TPR) repeat protein
MNLEATLRLDAKDPVTNRLLVDALLRLGLVDEADRAAEKYFKAEKDSATGWFLRALVLEGRKSTDKALDAYRKAVKKDPRFLDAHGNLALLLASSNPGYADKAKIEEAVAAAQKYCELGGKSLVVVNLLKKLKEATEAAPEDKPK